jgi:hypothetical protein
MLKDGIYRVYSIKSGYGKPVERQVSKFFIKNGKFYILEDHDNLMEDVIEGPITPEISKKIFHLCHTPYFKVISDKQANEGAHDDVIPEMSLGDVDPDAKYFVWNGIDQPKILEIYGINTIFGGKQISKDELKELFAQVQLGKYKMEKF